MKLKLILAFAIITTISCGENDNSTPETTFGIFTVLDDNTVEMNGDINSSTLRNFENLVNEYPSISQIEIREVPGSLDDEINLQFSKKVHDSNIAIHLLDNGIIASGGVDFFLAGVRRTKGINTMIGVHSWAGENETATDFPEGHANHLPYINYYISIGFTQQEAEDFYYFTINAAPASSIHYMTESEIEQYGLLKL